MSRPKKGLRPINDTRRADGTLTSETAARLFRRRAGLARARQQAADGYQMLAQMRVKSILVRSLKAASKKDCHRCKPLSEYLTRALEQLRHEEPTQLSDSDARLLR